MGIAVSGLSKSFDGKTIFENISFDVPERGIMRIDGASGCGKTTLLRVIAGLLPADSGTVCGMEDKKIAFVFQEDRLLPWRTALHNVALAADTRRARDWLEAVGLAGDENKLPSELSGGMRRRVAIARALAYGGDILILDEPFSGIDEECKRGIIVPLVAKYAQEHPVLLVTHDALDVQLLGAHTVFKMPLPQNNG